MKRVVPLRWIWALLLALAPLAARARAGQAGGENSEAQESVLVEVRVTAVLGETIYLDRGAEARLEVGDRVSLRSSGRQPVEAELDLVTRTSSRAVLVSGAAAVGDIGEVRIPGARPSAPRVLPGEVWEHPPETFDPTRPLLAPSAHAPPAERPRTMRGRAFAALDAYYDGEPGGKDAWLARTGFDATLTNPFGKGGVLDVRMEAFRRDSGRDEGREESTRLRIDRLSYRIGGTREESRSLAVGRFLHGELPELGLLDGVEFVQRLRNGDRLGASLGYLPEPFAELDTGDDLAASLFYRGYLGPSAELSYAGAFQKTWHHGEADRDLVLAALDWTPGSVFSLHGGAWVDLYGSDAAAKDSGAELTELHLAANWRLAQERGFGLSATHVKWPELERDEFPETSLADLAQVEVSRVGVHAYGAPSERLRLRARADLWEDQDQSGASGEVELGRARPSGAPGEVALALFANDAKFVSVYGARLSARRRGPRFGWRLAYEAALFDRGSIGDLGDATLQHLLRAGLDRDFARGWSLALDGDYRFGEDQQGFAVGLFLARRF